MSLKRYLIKVNFILRQATKHKRYALRLIFTSSILILLFLYVLLIFNNDPLEVQQPYFYLEPITSYYRYNHKLIKKDWHDYKFMELQAKRVGPGENGTPVFPLPHETEKAQKIFNENKHNGLVSDKIARDRSIPDTRPEGCKVKKYLSDLPKVSIIIPFHNEILSTLTRTVHSVFNRSPPELLREVILVNDHSDKEYCYEPLEDYIKTHFDVSKIKILVMKQRSGLMWARLAGARAASSDILIFLDCHTEANVNFLPPLIEPIALDYRTVTCPYIDVISAQDYRYSGIAKGARGVFNWQLIYQFLPVGEEWQKDPTENFKSPVMMGCVFAISAKFFWELGGYDHGLEIWGGEQYELSFKTWLCHGQQLDVPCSRVGHLYRPRPFTKAGNHTDYVWYNFKRVAATWMDDYEKYLTKGGFIHKNEIDIGDISFMLNIKKKLNCKPFKYFLDVVAPDMLDKFPFVEPPEFASGGIQSLANPTLCIDTLGVEHEQQIGVYACKNNLTHPGWRQTFKLRNHRDISVQESNNECLDFNHDKILLYTCKFEQKNQYFRYDLNTKQIFCGSARENNCMELEMKSKKLIYKKCDANKITQKWKFGFVNETMLNDWVNFGKRILDENEVEDLNKKI